MSDHRIGVSRSWLIAMARRMDRLRQHIRTADAFRDEYILAPRDAHTLRKIRAQAKRILGRRKWDPAQCERGLRSAIKRIEHPGKPF